MVRYARMAPLPEAPRVRLGELLVQSGVLTADKLGEALRLQKDEGGKRRLGQVLVESGFVDETQLTQVLGRQLAVPWVSLYHVDFSRQLLNLVPREVAEGYGLIPVYVRHVRGQGETLYVATDDPTNDEGLRRVGAYAGLPVRPMIASASDIRAAIRVYYGGAAPLPAPTPAASPAPSRAPSEPPPTRASSPRALNEDQPSTRPDSPAVLVAAEPPPPSAPPRTLPAEAKAPKLEIVDDGPEIEATSIALPPRKKQRTIALTVLDGTTLNLPAPRTKAQKRGRAPAAEAPPSSETPGAPDEDGLTARDLVSALRAVSHGADASEILGENPRWEAMFAAILSLLLKKHLIADWEFVDELKKSM
jgi:type IV pilus assembly protein PilB